MINIKGICYIVGACNDYSEAVFFEPTENDLVIAADGGYDILKKKNIEADILLGDFDSIESLPAHSNIIKHPVQKDDTDTFLAYKTAMEHGYRNFVIFGGIGGRLDHTIANLQTLLHIANHGGRAFLIGNDTVVTTIYNAKLSFSSDFCGNISVFAQGSTAEKVKIQGLKYLADNISLNPDTPMGVSNEFVGERAEVSVENGKLLVVWNEKSADFLKHIDDFLI